jgi:hypothetical protein
MLGLLLFLAQAANSGLVDAARSLPPEFCADALLRLSALPPIRESKQRRELIEEAFIAGAHAPLPYPRTLDDPHTGLDALTLQTRAVNAMLALDASRALAMFRDIPPPDPPRLTCQDAATPELSAYYQTAGRLFESAFSAAQRSAEDDMRFLQQIIASIQSPSQVVPALKMMPDAGARLSGVQRGQLAGAFAGILDRVAGSDREYAASENVLVPSAVPEMRDSQMFVPALRSYIVRHLAAARCRDALPANGLPESARQFNALIARLSQTTAQLRPITAGEAAPVKVEGTYERRPAPSNLPSIADLHSLERQYPILQNSGIWFSQVQAMLRNARSSEEFSEMARSSNPIIALYARLATLTGRP